MRYDASGGQYIYNFATKYLSDANAKYYFYVRLGADQQISRGFGLKSK